MSDGGESLDIGKYLSRIASNDAAAMLVMVGKVEKFYRSNRIFRIL
jgi:hypothetical protein